FANPSVSPGSLQSCKTRLQMRGIGARQPHASGIGDDHFLAFARVRVADRETHVAAARAAARLERDLSASDAGNHARAFGYRRLRRNQGRVVVGLSVVIGILRDDPAVLPVVSRTASLAVA